MDVMISSGWRTPVSTFQVDRQADETVLMIPTTLVNDTFISKHGRFEVTLCRDGDGWLVQYTSTGRLFGPRVVIYTGRHRVARHAAWDVMARVIRATDDEQLGIRAGRQAAAWLRERDLSI